MWPPRPMQRPQLIGPAPVGQPMNLVGALNGQQPQAPMGPQAQQAPAAAASAPQMAKPLPAAGAAGNDFRKQMALQLMGQAGSGRPVGSHMEGVARLGQGLVGALLANKAGKVDSAQQQAMVEALQGASGNLSPDIQKLIPFLAPEQAAKLVADANAPGAIGENFKVVDGRLVDLSAEGGPSVVLDAAPDKPTTTEAERLAQKMADGTATQYDKARWEKLTRDGPQTSVTVSPQINLPSDNEITGELFKLDAERLGKAEEAATSASQMAPQLEQLLSLIQSTPTGAGEAMLLPARRIADAIGIESENLTEQQLMNSIVSELTPRMRAPGSGATSDMEMKTFREAIGGLGTTPEANTLRWGGMLQMARRAEQEYELMRDYLRTNKNLDGFKKYAKEALGETWPTVEGDEDYESLPSKTVFQDDSGKFFFKP